MLKIRIIEALKCKKHPKFDPLGQGSGAIVGGCKGCWELVELQDQVDTFNHILRMWKEKRDSNKGAL